MQVRLSDSAELFFDRRGQCTRATARWPIAWSAKTSTNGPSSPWTGAAGRQQRSESVAHPAPSTSWGAVDILFCLRRHQCARSRYRPLLLTALRRLADRRVPLGALCTGGYALARAGLLDNFSATIHWENLSALREEFPPSSNQRPAVHHRQGPRFTCSGGTAPLDLMLNLIQVKLGPKISQIGVRAIHRRASPQRTRITPIHSVAGAGGRVAPWLDSSRAAHGGEH